LNESLSNKLTRILAESSGSTRVFLGKENEVSENKKVSFFKKVINLPDHAFLEMLLFHWNHLKLF